MFRYPNCKKGTTTEIDVDITERSFALQMYLLKFVQNAEKSQ